MSSDFEEFLSEPETSISEVFCTQAAQRKVFHSRIMVTPQNCQCTLQWKYKGFTMAVLKGDHKNDHTPPAPRADNVPSPGLA